jgi:uncharacterized protein (TIGR00296 family)
VILRDSDGAELVRLARAAVEKYVTVSAVIDPLKQLPKSGVFVTIHHLTDTGEELRGCVGFPMAYKDLHQSIIEAAIAAATEDPRFQPIVEEELDDILFEVSVLTDLEEIVTASPWERKRNVVIGRDGLVLKWRHGSGLLLPQVPIEYSWDAEEYLANICFKAGAPPDAWLDASTRLYRFQTIIFKEETPRGKVLRLDLSEAK